MDILSARILYRHFGLFLSLTLACGPGSAFAQELVALHESYYFEELPVTLTPTRLSQPLEDIPSSITVIDKDMIRASGALSIPDILRLVPGFTVAFYAGSRAAATYHGLSDQYARDMQVLIDGRSVYDPGYGGVAWFDLPLDIHDVNRIEVVRGPNATAYGSNAYAGVINIITDLPADVFGSQISVTVGEGARRKLYGRHADQVGDFSFKINTAFEEGDGFDDRADDFDYGWVNLSGEKKLDEDNLLSVRIGASQGSYEEGFSTLFQQVRELDDKYSYQQIIWDHNSVKDNHFRLQFYHNHQKIDDFYMSPPISEMLMSLEELQAIPEAIRLDYFANIMGAPNFASLLSAMGIGDAQFIISWLGMESDRYDLEFEQTIQANEAFRFAWGLGLRRDQAKSMQIFHQNGAVSRDQSRLFINGEWHANKKTVLNIGGMLEDYEGHDPIYSYRAAGNYHIDQHNTIRLNASRAYRMPTLYEEHVNFILFADEPFNDFNNWLNTTGDIDPQSIDSIELGYTGNFFNHGLAIDVKLFEERYRDIIRSFRDHDYPEPDRDLSDTTVLDNFNEFMHEGTNLYTNNGSVDTYGIELNLKLIPSHKDLIFLGYSYMQTKGEEIRKREDGNYIYDKNLSERAPAHTLSLLLSHRFHSDIETSAVYYYTDAVTWYGEGDPVPSYRRLDLRIAKQFKLFDSESEISLLIQNINEDNLEFYDDDDFKNVWSKRAYLQFKSTF
jgi:iron complex outermembrane receptor protein